MTNDKSMIIDVSEKEIKEIVTKANIKQTKVKQCEEVNYSHELDKIIIPSSKDKVIYTDGINQLKYENGEFFCIDTKDATKSKVKLTRKEATDMYIEFFIKNRLNPLIEKKQELRSINMNFREIEKSNENNYSLNKDKIKKIENDDYLI